MNADLVDGPGGSLFYYVSSTGAFVYVDAVSGRVAEVVLQGSMPADDAVATTNAEASSAAAALIGESGWAPSGIAPSVTMVHVAGVAFQQVDWSTATTIGPSPGEVGPVLRVLVNAGTGAVFALVDTESGANLAPPVIGRERAAQIGIAADGVEGDQLLGADFQTSLTDSGQVSSWIVGVGVPTATQADVYGHGAAIEVNAVTGDATILKTDRSPGP